MGRRITKKELLVLVNRMKDKREPVMDPNPTTITRDKGLAFLCIFREGPNTISGKCPYPNPLRYGGRDDPPSTL